MFLASIVRIFSPDSFSIHNGEKTMAKHSDDRKVRLPVTPTETIISQTTVGIDKSIDRKRVLIFDSRPGFTMLEYLKKVEDLGLKFDSFFQKYDLYFISHNRLSHFSLDKLETGSLALADCLLSYKVWIRECNRRVYFPFL